jgi:hypothetical protein
MLGVLASYSITVKELKLLFGAMKAVNGKWVSIQPLCVLEPGSFPPPQSMRLWKEWIAFILLMFWVLFMS